MVSFYVKLLFMFPSPWSRLFGPNFPQIAIMPQIPKSKLDLILRWLCQLIKALFNVNHGVGDFGLLFICPRSWLPSWGNFAKLPCCLKYPRTDITSPSDSLVPGLKPHLMWNIELKFLYYFGCVLAYHLVVLGYDLISPNYSNVSNALKQV